MNSGRSKGGGRLFIEMVKKRALQQIGCLWGPSFRQERFRVLAVVLCGLLLILPNMPLAQESLTLDQAIRLAMAQNPAVQASASAQKGAAERLTQTRAGYLPEVNYSESLQWGNNPVYVFGSLLEQHRFRSNNFELGSLNRPDALTNFASQLTVSETLFDGNKTKDRRQAAHIANDMAGERNRESGMDILQEAIEAYYTAVVAQNNQQVAEEAYHTAQSDLEHAQSLHDTGMTTDADVLALRVHLAEIQDQRIRARNNVRVARARLNDVLAVPLETEYTLSTPLRPASTSVAKLEEYEARALRDRPEARQAEMAVSLAETDSNLARAALLPELTLHGVFEANRQSFAARGGSDWMTGATLSWNLFRGFADRSRIAESSFLKTQREQEKRRTESALQLQVRQSFWDLESASSRVMTAQTAVAEAEENHRIVANRYDAGVATVTELLRSQTALNAAKMRHLGAIFDQRIAAVRLERAAGSLNPSSDVLKP
jgi:outer membrane protein